MIANGKTARRAGAAALKAWGESKTYRRSTMSNDGRRIIIATVRWSWRS
jgi:hypothetical protein